MPITDAPEPSKGRAGKSMRGSFLATCNSKCNLCEPCRPVEVSVRSNALALEENYYPQVWKCIVVIMYFRLRKKTKKQN